METGTAIDRRRASVGELLDRLGETLAARRVLVVEDDESAQDFYQQVFDVLFPKEFRHEIAPTGEKALEALKARSFDAVILDWALPGRVDGLAVLARLRSDPALARLPVLMVSARDEDEAETAARAAGADDYLAKPVHPDVLIDRLRRLRA